MVHWQPWQSLHGRSCIRMHKAYQPGEKPISTSNSPDCVSWRQMRTLARHSRLSYTTSYAGLKATTVLQAFSYKDGLLHSSMDDLVQGYLHPAEEISCLHHIFIPDFQKQLVFCHPWHNRAANPCATSTQHTLCNHNNIYQKELAKLKILARKCRGTQQEIRKGTSSTWDSGHC